MTLPALSTTNRYALKALKLEASQVLHEGMAWLCQGKAIVRTMPLSRVTFPLPKGVNTLCVSASDLETVRTWIG